ncbi:MAG: molecular chaperone DnaK [Gemmatimonadetes bacterium]|nr:MAG: molecular chaperone DnaK [Gemmatimonadota bacterium]
MSRKVVLTLLLVAAAGLGVTRFITASDHKDSMLLAGDPAADIADIYTFRSPTNPANVVLAMTVSGFIPPSEASTTFFDPNVLYQWKIDNDGDAVEDLVMQAFVTGTGGHQVMHFRGPAKASELGSTTRVIEGPETATVAVSNTATPIAATRNGMTVFAGVRDDPFFFDLVQFKKIIAGQATSFRNPGVDTFAGTNVLAIVVELPSSMLGGTKLGVWGSTSRPQL